MNGDFRWINKQLAVDIADKAVDMIATEVWADAIAFAPHDTGTLGRSIVKEKAGTAYTVGTNLHYAVFVEFGTKHSPVPPGRTLHGGQRPFLGPALAKAKRKWKL